MMSEKCHKDQANAAEPNILLSFLKLLSSWFGLFLLALESEIQGLSLIWDITSSPRGVEPTLAESWSSSLPEIMEGSSAQFYLNTT